MKNKRGQYVISVENTLKMIGIEMLRAASNSTVWNLWHWEKMVLFNQSLLHQVSVTLYICLEIFVRYKH